MTEKPVAIVLPSWDPNEPRFIITECPRCSEDRTCKNGQCVYNQRLGFCYSVDEIVEVLNASEDEKDKFKQRLNDKDKLLSITLTVNENLSKTLLDNEEIIKSTVKNERTKLGQSVLKNLAANLGIKI